MTQLHVPNETVFTMETTPLKFGSGATDEVGHDLKRLGVRRLLLVTDGLAALGFGEADMPALVDGALKQQRLLAGSPRPVGPAELEAIARASMQHW